MSTDWIKMRVDLRTHPKVVRMSSALKADKLRVIGGLFAVWAIFDAHAVDGVLQGYTFDAIDDDLRWKGFAASMASIEWLTDLADAGLEAPRFDEHNGQSAKRRAQETERKRQEREAEKAVADAPKTKTETGQLSASDADTKRTREEKRREEKKETGEKTPPASPWLESSDLVVDGLTQEVAEAFIAHRRVKKAKLTALAWDGFKAEVLKAGWTNEAAALKAISRNWTAFEAEWVAKEARPGHNGSKQTALETRNRAVINDFLLEAK